MMISVAPRMRWLEWRAVAVAPGHDSSPWAVAEAAILGRGLAAMTGRAEGSQVVRVVEASTIALGDDVVDLSGLHDAADIVAILAERVMPELPLAQPSPGASIV